MKIPKIISSHVDEEVDAAYARFTNERVVKSVPIDEDFIFDLDANGNVVGVEILNFSDYGDDKNSYVSALEHMPASGQSYFA